MGGGRATDTESKGGGRATDRLSESREEWAAEEAARNPGLGNPVEVPERRTREKVRIDSLLRDETTSWWEGARRDSLEFQAGEQQSSFSVPGGLFPAPH